MVLRGVTLVPQRGALVIADYGWKTTFAQRDRALITSCWQ
jgi:hypothetical protein